ncbi:MAG TPA: hypothetical protein VK849_13175 [Longimicrobiales bacterium]|nr:hypothetical protein [Longimicrobiales bacterium]
MDIRRLHAEGARTGRSGPATPLSRRGFLATGLASLTLPSLLACLERGTGPTYDGNPRLSARPGVPTEVPQIGATVPGIEIGRDAILYVPEGYDPDTPSPMMVALHGAGGSAASWSGFQPLCGGRNMILLAVDSRGSTWDRVRGAFGPDVFYLDEVLAYTFARCRVDPDRLALAGFSDGASYALSLGVSNGDLFSHLIAFSPGFYLPAAERVGKPRVFVSHGGSDPIIAFQASRDHIVPMLQEEGFDVTFREFDGGHSVPETVATEALDWMLA